MRQRYIVVPSLGLLHGSILFLDAATATARAGQAGFLLEVGAAVVVRGIRAVEFFFKDGLVLDGLEFGLGGSGVAGGGAEAVAAAAGLGHVVSVVLELVALTTPWRVLAWY